MKEMPKPISIILLTVGFILLAVVIFRITQNNGEQSNSQYLDQLQIETNDPQPVGKNTAP